MKKMFALFAAAIFVSAPVSHASPTSLTGATVETYFSPNGGAGAAIAAAIDAARTRVLLAGYSFTSKAVAAALVRAHARGVPVRVVLDVSNQTLSYSGAKYLANGGIEVKVNAEYPIMHHKFVIADQVIGFGSMNFTQAGDFKNAENFNLFRGAPALVALYEAEFVKLEAESVPYQMPLSAGSR